MAIGYRNHWLVALCLLKSGCFALQRARFANDSFIAQGVDGDEDGPPVHIAFMIAGQTSRFVYKEALEHLSGVGGVRGFACGSVSRAKCTVDVFIALAKTKVTALTDQIRSQGPSLSFQEVPYSMDSITIIDAFTESGADSVHVRIIEPETMQAIAMNVSSAISKVISKRGKYTWEDVEALSTDHRDATINMLYMRHAAYVEASTAEPIGYYKYTGFLFVRDDTVFLNPQYTLRSLVQKQAQVLVLDRCGFRSYCDKIYFAKPDAARVLFAPTEAAHVETLASWLEYGVSMKNEWQPLQIERFLQHHMEQARLTVERYAFGRADVRYVLDTACVDGIYYLCDPDTYKYFEKCPQ